MLVALLLHGFASHAGTATEHARDVIGEQHEHGFTGAGSQFCLPTRCPYWNHHSIIGCFPRSQRAVCDAPAPERQIQDWNNEAISDASAVKSVRGGRRERWIIDADVVCAGLQRTAPAHS